MTSPSDGEATERPTTPVTLKENELKMSSFSIKKGRLAIEGNELECH